MEQAILLLHLALVVFLIVLILLQRSEGGALGMGGGGGGVVTGRGATTALQRFTWYLAAGFLATSLTLNVLAQSDRQGGSVLDGVSLDSLETEQEDLGGGLLDNLAPPTIGGDAPAGGSENLPSVPAE
jgi:preprotein translocase subunit SecG